MTIVKRGDRVSFHYSLSLADGTLVESSDTVGEIDVVIGSGELPVLIEQALMERTEGEEIDIMIRGDQGLFGPYDGEKVQQIPLKEFTSAPELAVGNLMEFGLPNDETVPGRILEIDNDMVRVDFNHPLLGRDCRYRAKILRISPDNPSAEHEENSAHE